MYFNFNSGLYSYFHGLSVCKRLNIAMRDFVFWDEEGETESGKSERGRDRVRERLRGRESRCVLGCRPFFNCFYYTFN